MTRRIRPSSPAVRFAVTLLLLQLTGRWAMPQELDSAPPKSTPARVELKRSDVQQIFVPAHQPAVWPKGNWEVLDTKEYRRLLEGLKRKPPEPVPARISHAKYEAIFSGRNLNAGQLTAAIQQTTDSDFLSLDPINLAIQSLWWDEGDKSPNAVWGNAASGETLLVFPERGQPADRSETAKTRTLRGEWSVAGRKFSNRFEFDLKLLPASVNDIVLYLPRSWTLTSSAGLVEGPFELTADSPKNGIPESQRDRFRQWNIHWGSEWEGRLTMYQSSPGKPSPGLLLAESNTTYLIRERELQVEARYELEAAFASVSQVVFEVPDTIRIFAVTYGAETNLEWHLKPRGKRQLIEIQLPDPLLGKSRPLRIQGLGKVEPEQVWQLPMITCSQAALLRGELHLTLEAPLELRSYQTAGFRQTGISVQPDQQETLTFSQIAPDSRASFKAFIGTPDFTVAAQIASRLTTGTEEWQMRSEIAWNVQAGSEFSTTCEVRPGWEVLDVRPTGDTTLPVIADWHVLKGPKNAPANLKIEFLEALTPMQSKRVVVLARRLPLTAGQAMSLSCIKPLSCRSVEEFLWVESQTSPGNIFVAEPSSDIVQQTIETLPAFARQSALFSHASSPKSQEGMFFHSKNGSSDGRLVLHTTEPPYEADLNVSVVCSTMGIEETITLAINPLETPIDRLTISAVDFKEGWTWDLQSPQRMPGPMPLQFAAQNGQAAEEREPTRWDLRLPMPQSKPFKLVATRKTPLAGQHRVALPFLPAARTLHCGVELRSETEIPWNLETTALTEETLVDLAMETLPTEVRRFEYRSSDARLILERATSKTDQPPQLARLQLTSLFNGNSHSAIHRARYEFESHSDEAVFSVQLPDRVKLIEILANGTPITTMRSDRGLIRLPLPSEQENAIEIHYESEWPVRGVVSSQAVRLPLTDVKVLEFRWRFGLSPNLRLVRSPIGLSMTTTPPETHWTRRFFGPLGRGSTAEPFRPWKWSAWENLFRMGENRNEHEGDSSTSNFLPADWPVYEAQAPRIGETIELQVWNQSQGLRWAWLALLTSLLIGFGLRIKAWSYRRQLGLFWFLVNFAGAGLLPMPWAMLAGGCLTGTLLALLFPRRLLVWQRTPVKSPARPGSTASFQHQPVITLALLVSGGLGIVLVSGLGFPLTAQGQQSAPAEPARPDEPNLGIRRFNVLVPVEDPRNPQFDSSVVYIDRDFLKKLQAAQPKPRPANSYLISSVKYQAQTDQPNAVQLTATFDIAVLNPQQPITVRLPLDEVFLGGPGHCLVDGNPHPVLLDGNGKGFLIELAPKPTPLPAIAEKPRQSISTTQRLEMRQITLRLHGVVTSLPNGGRFAFSVPPVSSSEFHIRFPETYASIGVRGLPGQFQMVTDSKFLSARIGSTPKLEVFWSRQANPLPPTNQQPPKVFALATIHPLRIEWQIRISSLPKWVSSARTWTLPPNTVVQELKSTHPVSFEASSAKTGTKLLVEFQDPVPGELTVDITCMTPRDQSSSALPSDVQIPALDLFSDSSKSELVKGIEYQIGVVATPELAMSPPSPDFLVTNDIVSISPEKFLTDVRQAATETRTLRNPQFAWRLASPSRLELTQEPRLPKRRASVSQEGRIQRGEIQWRFTAAIETTTATAFRHVLNVPQKLVVDSVSVQEDETERLVRWSQMGDRIELVLSDGTTGSQSVELTGHLPIDLESGNRIPLPLIQIEDATISDSRLRVYQDFHAEQELQLTGIENLPALDANGAKTKRGIPRLLAGVHLTNSDASPALAVGALLEAIQLRQAMIVSVPASNRYQVTTWLHLDQMENSPQRFSVHLPAEMTKDFRVELVQKPGEIIPYETITKPNQALELVFDSVSFEEQSTLRIVSSVSNPAASPWTLPQINVTGAQVEALLLGIPSTFAIRSGEDFPSPAPLAPDEIPDWIFQNDSQAFDFDEIRLYRPPREPWQMIPHPSSETRPTDSPTLQITLWLTDPKAIVGEIHTKLPESAQESLTWNWPPNTALRAAMLDGELLPASVDRDTHTLQLAIPSLPQPHRTAPRTLELYWIQELEKPLPRFGQMDLIIPKPHNESFESATVKVLPPNQTELIANEGLERNASPEQEPNTVSADIVLTGSLPLASENWPLSFWTMDSRAESMLLVCVLVLLLGGFLHWGLRWNTGQWLHDHPAFAGASLGLIWWACLTGSVFGFALVLLSPIVAIAAKLLPAQPPNVPSA